MRKAVVFIHGIGEQRPMENLLELAEILKPKDSVLFSSPNRIISDFETRRISYSKEKIDFYELYWAHLSKDADFFETLMWSINLLFTKPSERLKLLLPQIKTAITIFIFVAIGLFIYFKEQINASISGFVIKGAVASFILYKILFPIIKSKISSTFLSYIGDIVNYTIPSPEHISTRHTIRNQGMELLKKLHEAKDDNQKDQYNEIIVIGHSLGSIIGYDLINNLFPNYHRLIDKQPIKNETLQEPFFKSMNYVKQNITTPQFKEDYFQISQNEVFNNFRKLGFGWKISHFITLGSPLCHAEMLLEKGKKDFANKLKRRELPTCPPIMDIIDNNLYAFELKSANLFIPHHAAQFGVTQWTNIFFENDFIGGNIQKLFGKGIKNIRLKPTRKNARLLKTHTKYWDNSERNSIEIIKKILGLYEQK